MTDSNERLKRLKAKYFDEAGKKCGDLADQEPDLTDEEREQLFQGCRVHTLDHFAATEERCEIQKESHWIFKERRYQSCMTKGVDQKAPDLPHYVPQKAAEIRAKRPEKTVKVNAVSEELLHIINDLEKFETRSPHSGTKGVPHLAEDPPNPPKGSAPSSPPSGLHETTPRRVKEGSEATNELMVQGADHQEEKPFLSANSVPEDAGPSLMSLRTYKVGLRVPPSLLDAFTPLVQKCQVLQFCARRQNRRFSVKQQARLQLVSGKYRDPNIQAFEEFKVLNTLEGAPPSVLAHYQAVLNSYSTFSAAQLKAELVRVKIALANLKTKKPQLTAIRFEKADVPQFKDPANPAPAEISLHDYQYLANWSLKRICAHLNQFAQDHIAQIPTDREELIAQAAAAKPALNVRHLRRHPYKAASIVLGKGANLDQMALEPMMGMLEVYRDLQEKVEVVNTLLFPPLSSAKGADFTDVPPVLLLYYSIPKNVLTYLAAAWDVEPQWVRNTLVGWRRKVDPHLPIPVQIEAVRDLMQQLADHCQRYVRSKEAQHVLFLLHRYQVLHLLQEPGIDLRPLVPAAFQAGYAQLQRVVPPFPAPLQAAIRRQTTSFSGEQLQQGGAQFKRRLEAALRGMPTDSRRFKNLQTLLHKVDVVLQEAANLRGLFTHFLPGNRYTRTITRLFLTLKAVQQARVTRLFSALRGIIALTFAQINPGATGHLQRVLTPKWCVTLPYTSSKRKKQFLPAHLIFNKWVVERQAYPELKQRNAVGQEMMQYLTNVETTHRFQDGQPIWLGIPIYAPAQLVDGYLQGQRKGRFWFQLSASAKIRECIQRGAWVRTIRLNVPRGPTGKIVADVVLEAADKSAFQHRTKFVRAWDAHYAEVPFPPGTYLGIDLNPIGAHAVALGTERQPIDLRAGPNLLRDFEVAHGRLEKHRQWEIPHLQRKLAVRTGSTKKRGRQKAQITLLHQRRARIMQELKQRRVPMVYLYGIYRTGAQYASWDAIQGLTPQGRGATLATAITYMAKARGLLEVVQEWARDLQVQGWIPQFQGVQLVPLVSSKVCAECVAQGRGLRQTRAAEIPYHEYQCEVCGARGYRHSNAARVAALLLQSIIEKRPLPLSTG